MVQIKSAAIAFVLIAPALALPLQNLDERSTQELDARASNFHPREDIPDVLELSERDLEETLAARDPINFKKIGRGAFGFAKKWGPKALGLLIREDEEGLYTREELLDILDLAERDPEEIEDLAARDPINFRRIGRKAFGFAKKWAPKALNIAGSILRRDEEDGLYTREDILEILDLVERDPEEIEALAARDPINFRRVGRKAFGFAKKWAPKALNIASSVLRREEDDGLYTREDIFDILDLSERDLDSEDMEALAARDPINFRKLGRSAFGFAKKWGPKALGLLIREDDDGFYTREDASVDDILARDYDFDLLD